MKDQQQIISQLMAQRNHHKDCEELKHKTRDYHGAMLEEAKVSVIEHLIISICSATPMGIPNFD